MSDCGKTVWWELLCNEETESAGLRHAPLIWDRGWLSGGRSPSQPVHSPAPAAHFHVQQGVALRSVLTHQHLRAAQLFSALLCVFTPDDSNNKQQEKRSSGTKTKNKNTRLSDSERGQRRVGLFQCLVKGGEDEKRYPRYFSRRRCSPGSSEWVCADRASFSGLPLEKIPLTVLRHLVEAARSGLPVNSASAVEEQAAVCRSSLSGGLRQNLTWTTDPRGLGI